MKRKTFLRIKYYLIVAGFAVSAIIFRIALLGMIRDEAYLDGLGPYLIVPTLIGIIYGMYYLVHSLDKADKYDRLVELAAGTPTPPTNQSRDQHSHQTLAD